MNIGFRYPVAHRWQGFPRPNPIVAVGGGTNGQVLTADSAQALGVKWATPTGGSGNGVPERWYVPNGADEGYDDEFDDGAIDADWTAVDVSGKANSWYEPSGIKGLSCIAPASKGALAVSGQLKSMGAMTAPCYIETAIMQSAKDSNFHGYGLIFSNGVTVGAGVQVIFTPLMQYYMTIAIMSGYNSRSSFNDWGYRDSAEIAGRIYLRLAWTEANKFSTFYSNDGVVWIPIHTNFEVTLTPTYFGLCDVQYEDYAIPRCGNFAYFRARSGSPANG
jgi:hypothetical protein